MDIRLFFSTFALIFLAELGDKTQLAAFAATAGSRSPWSIFAGASAALVLSTLIAILVGSALQKVVPPHYLKTGAGILFVVFGIILLWAGLHPAAEARTEAIPARTNSVLARMVFSVAAEFEKAASADYDAFAAATSDPLLRELFLQLADEERSHLEKIRHAAASHGDVHFTRTVPASVGPLNHAPEAFDDKKAAILADIARHEKATADFYQELAEKIPVAALRPVFARLAAEEHDHARRLTGS